MIKACIFDLDGTVIDTTESLRYSVSETMRQFGYPGITAEQTRAFVGNGGRNLIKRALHECGNDSEQDVDRVLAVYKKVFSENCTRGNVAYPGMEDTLKQLRSVGVKLAVISNKSQERVEDCIAKVYGSSLFDILRGERPGVPLKPDPTAIIQVTDELGVKPRECLYVGDGDTDMIAGKAAGCNTVAVTWGFRPAEVLGKLGPDHMINRAVDLLTVLKYHI